MKAIVLKEDNSLSLEEVETPVPKDNEVLIRIAASGFNPIDYQMRENEFERKYLFSPILGRELSGIIAAKGKEVSSLNIGQEVFCACGSMGSNGSYAEYISVPQEIVALKPVNVSFQQAAALPSVGITALQVFNRIDLSKHHSVFITGASGGVGNLLVKLLLAHQHNNFIAVAGNAESIEQLKSIGVADSKIVNYKNEVVSLTALAKNGNSRFDYAVDCVGNRFSEIAVDVLQPNGVYVDVTNFATPTAKEKLFDKGATIHNISNFIYASEKNYTYFKQSLTRIAKLIENNAIAPPVIEVIGSLSAYTAEKAQNILKTNLTKGKKLIMSVT